MKGFSNSLIILQRGISDKIVKNKVIIIIIIIISKDRHLNHQFYVSYLFLIIC